MDSRRQDSQTRSKKRHEIQFECTQCNACCKDRNVGITDADLRIIKDGIQAHGLEGEVSDYVHMQPLIGVSRIRTTGGYVGMSLLKVDGKCKFLTDDGCSIYDYRPMPCRLFPFTPVIRAKTKGVVIEWEFRECPGLGSTTKTLKSGKKKKLRIPADIVDLGKRWANARRIYDYKVNRWNHQDNRDLNDFVEMCLKSE